MGELIGMKVFVVGGDEEDGFEMFEGSVIGYNLENFEEGDEEDALMLTTGESDISLPYNKEQKCYIYSYIDQYEWAFLTAEAAEKFIAEAKSNGAEAAEAQASLNSFQIKVDFAVSMR